MCTLWRERCRAVCPPVRRNGCAGTAQGDDCQSTAGGHTEAGVGQGSYSVSEPGYIAIGVNYNTDLTAAQSVSLPCLDLHAPGFCAGTAQFVQRLANLRPASCTRSQRAQTCAEGGRPGLGQCNICSASHATACRKLCSAGRAPTSLT